MSAYLIGGNSAKSDRRAEGRTEGKEAERSARVSVRVTSDDSESKGECDSDAKKRLMAIVPASRTSALRSAPTYPCARDENARSSS